MRRTFGAEGCHRRAINHPMAKVESRFPTLLAAWPRRPIGASGALSGGRGVGLAPEELLLAEAELGLEPGDLLVELGLACDGAVEPGLVVSGLPPGLELLGQPGADWARPLGDGGSRTGRGLIVPVQERDRSGIKPGSRGLLRRHVARCSRGRVGKPESRWVYRIFTVTVLGLSQRSTAMRYVGIDLPKKRITVCVVDQ